MYLLYLCFRRNTRLVSLLSPSLIDQTTPSGRGPAALDVMHHQHAEGGSGTVFVTHARDSSQGNDEMHLEKRSKSSYHNLQVWSKINVLFVNTGDHSTSCYVLFSAACLISFVSQKLCQTLLLRAGDVIATSSAAEGVIWSMKLVEPTHAQHASHRWRKEVLLGGPGVKY